MAEVVEAGVAVVIAQKLASALAGAIASKIGSKIISSLFPADDVPSYFGQVYERIKEIVGEEVAQADIDHLSGQVNGLKNWIQQTYEDQKNAGATKHDLHEMLRQQESHLTIDIIGPLMTAHPMQSLIVFMVAAGMHFAILQELALTDDKENPHESGYATSISGYVTKYVNHGVETFAHVEGTRVGFVQTRDDTRTPYPGEVVPTVLTLVDGGFTDTPESSFSDAASLDAAFDAHVAQVKEGLRISLGDPIAIVDQWGALKEHPLGAT